MNRLNMQSKNILGENMDFIASRFPNVITETNDEDGSLTKKIDFELLMQELSGDIVEGNKERYQLTWPGKKEAILMANTPIKKTLRPVVEDSVDFENTENLYIEGDNLEVLKLLQESYLGKIKCIYIDPPYNTGSDFIYKDNFNEALDDYLEQSGQVDESGDRLFQNTDTNGRFHSDWLSMIYSRLKISSNLLHKSGVIFISIGQEEVSNITKVADEIFGESNRVGIISRVMKSGSNKGKYFSKNIDYILVYSKDISHLKEFKEPLGEELIKKVYNQVEESGNRKGELYRAMGLYQASLDERPNQRYWIKCPDGSLVIPKGDTMPKKLEDGEKIKPISGDGVWRWTYDRYADEYKKGNILFKETSTSPLIDEKGNISNWNIYTKIWLNDRLDEGKVPVDFITKYENRHSSKEIQALDIPFDFAKPSLLIKYLIGIVGIKSNDIVLDFFSGSATTAHAVMSKNAEENSQIRYIMIQVPQDIDNKNKAYKQGYSNICEIGKERIRRAAQKIKQETNANIDYGFRVYKVDSTNMKDTYYNIEEISQSNLFEAESNIKEDRNPEDLLTQVILDLGLELSLKIEEKNINGKRVFYVDEDSLIACFDEGVDKEIAMEIAKDMPMKVVFRDSCFRDDSIKENIKEIFKKYSNDTDIKVL